MQTTNDRPDPVIEQRRHARDLRPALAELDRLRFHAERAVAIGAATVLGTNRDIDGEILLDDGSWELEMCLSDDDCAQACWDEGRVAGSIHSIQLPASCWSEEIITEALARWWVMGHPDSHLPEISLDLRWDLPEESHQRFLAQKRADSENRRLLG